MKKKHLLIILAIIIIGVGAMATVLLSSQQESVADRAETNSAKDPSETLDADKGTIYALGDSLTAGYQLPLEESYPMQLETMLSSAGYAYSVVNGGKSGDTSAGLLARITWLIEEAESGDIALLVIGANDGLQSLQLDQLEENIQNIITLLQAKDITVVLGGMQLPTNLDPIYREKFATLYETIARKNQLPYIAFFLEDVATIPTLNLPDGIHPNKEGYAIIAKNIYTFLETNTLISK